MTSTCPKLKICTKDDSITCEINDENKSEFDFELPKDCIFASLNDCLKDGGVFTNIYSDKNLLLVGTGAIKRLHILQSIKSLKFKRLVCVINSQNWASEYFDDIIIAEHEKIEQKSETLDKIKDFMLNNSMKFDAVITYDEFCVQITSFIAESINLPCIPYATTEKIKNKYRFRKLCRNLGIVTPKFFLINASEREAYLTSTKSGDAVENENDMCNFPIVVKNTYGSGKDFVRKCKNVDEFKQALKISELKDPKMNLLVEEYYEGLEIDMDILIQNDRVKFFGISDNFPAPEPAFYEQGGLSPSYHLSDEEKLKLKSIVSVWLTKLSLKNALLHFEARCRPGSLFKQVDTEFVMPIEINMRLGGVETPAMIKSSYNVDLIREYINICLGFELNENALSKAPLYRSISIKLYPPGKCVLNKVLLNKNKVKNNKELVEIFIAKPIESNVDSDYNIAWMSVRNDMNSTLDEMKANLKNALKCIKLEYN